MLGVSILAPWAVFSTANDFYVDFKLKWIAEDLKTDVGLLKRLEEYQDFFINYLGIVFQVPDTLVGDFWKFTALTRVDETASDG